MSESGGEQFPLGQVGSLYISKTGTRGCALLHRTKAALVSRRSRSITQLGLLARPSGAPGTVDLPNSL